jgi:hypothetical protein
MDPSPEISMSHERDVQPIWDEHCVEECHSPGGRIESVPLDASNAFETLLEQPSVQSELALVEPNDVEHSYLWHKLNNSYLDEPADGFGYAMPWGAPALSEEERSTIEAWIEDGALP